MSTEESSRTNWQYITILVVGIVLFIILIAAVWYIARSKRNEQPKLKVEGYDYAIYKKPNKSADKYEFDIGKYLDDNIDDLEFYME